MRLNPHFGELPSGAFQHCGDRKIRLQGGGGGFIDDIVDTVADPVKDFGSDVVGATQAFIDDPKDFTSNLIEYAGDNPVETALMIAAAYYAPDMTAAWLAETGAAAEAGTAAAAAATAAEAAAVAEGLTVAEAAIAAQTAYDAAIAANAAAAAEAFNIAQINAGLAESSAYFGLSPEAQGTFGTFNPSTTSGVGINTGSMAGTEFLGGSGSLQAGTAGLTAEQIAQANMAGQVGSNAASGLGYLGGSSSLPSGTAGITGVTAPLTITPKDAQDALKLGEKLFGGQDQQAYGGLYQGRQNGRQAGMVDYSPTLSLLNQRATTPNVYSLLG